MAPIRIYSFRPLPGTPGPQCCLPPSSRSIEPPIFGICWAGTSNIFSQSCKDYHVKSCINYSFMRKELFVSNDRLHVKKANEHGLLLGFAHSTLREPWRRRNCHSELCCLLSGSSSNSHLPSPVIIMSKKLGFSFTWWRRKKSALRDEVAPSLNFHLHLFDPTFWLVYSVINCSKLKHVKHLAR